MHSWLFLSDAELPGLHFPSCSSIFILPFSSKYQIQRCLKFTRAEMSRAEGELIYFHSLLLSSSYLCRPYFFVCHPIEWLVASRDALLIFHWLSMAIRVKPFQSWKWKQTLPKQDSQYVRELGFIINADISFKCHCSLADHGLSGFLVSG